jgi:hypothetical protein
MTDMTETVEEVAFGAGEAVAEVAADPVGAARRQVKSFEKKGTPAARRVNRRLNRQIHNATAPAKDALENVGKTAARVANELDPEKVVLGGLRLVKVQAKRDDMVGDVAKQTLKFFNRSFKTVARVATRFENASELSPRTSPERSATRRPARRSRTRRTRRAA